MHYCPSCEAPCHCEGDLDDMLLGEPQAGCKHECADPEAEIEVPEEEEDGWCFDCDTELGKGDCDECSDEAARLQAEEEEEDEF